MIQQLGEVHPMWRGTKVLKTVQKIRLIYLDWMSNVEVGWDMKEDSITVWPFTEFRTGKTTIVYKAQKTIYVPFYCDDFRIVLKTYHGKIQK